MYTSTGGLLCCSKIGIVRLCICSVYLLQFVFVLHLIFYVALPAQQILLRMKERALPS